MISMAERNDPFDLIENVTRQFMADRTRDRAVICIKADNYFFVLGYFLYENFVKIAIRRHVLEIR